MQPKPKYTTGDNVKIIAKGDPEYGKIVQVTGMSPSTKRKRSRGQWRYRLSNGIYLSEDKLKKIKEQA